MIAQNRELTTIKDSTLIVAVDIVSQQHVVREINWCGHILHRTGSMPDIHGNSLGCFGTKGVSL
ncbi:hypothetical protein SAMN02745885_02778 [Carboxydocella sporoproducens DSM 16521]|uniref:Uncharacterized protein n=2 Tax=Carboxydocella TaxID=178898 RepID=A0A1T4SN18_9FIRM|nr:hypothetical protein CFE_2365 [Carboxydocella thermautotrophica]SKA29670.1 hypothetical protein SAMN02745885_02778 [Carboxydocella sporoproducens DSM 16521]